MDSGLATKKIYLSVGNEVDGVSYAVLLYNRTIIHRLALLKHRQAKKTYLSLRVSVLRGIKGGFHVFFLYFGHIIIYNLKFQNIYLAS